MKLQLFTFLFACGALGFSLYANKTVENRIALNQTCQKLDSSCEFKTSDGVSSIACYAMWTPELGEYCQIPMPKPYKEY